MFVNRLLYDRTDILGDRESLKKSVKIPQFACQNGTFPVLHSRQSGKGMPSAHGIFSVRNSGGISAFGGRKHRRKSYLAIVGSPALVIRSKATASSTSGDGSKTLRNKDATRRRTLVDHAPSPFAGMFEKSQFMCAIFTFRLRRNTLLPQ